MPLLPLFIQNEVGAGAGDRLTAFNFCNPFDHILPIANSVVSVSDRAQLWGLYSGIAIGVIIPPGSPGLEFTAQASKFQFTAQGEAGEYTAQADRYGYTANDEKAEYTADGDRLHYTTYRDDN